MSPSPEVGPGQEDPSRPPWRRSHELLSAEVYLPWASGRCAAALGGSLESWSPAWQMNLCTSGWGEVGIPADQLCPQVWPESFLVACLCFSQALPAARFSPCCPGTQGPAQGEHVREGKPWGMAPRWMPVSWRPSLDDHLWSVLTGPHVQLGYGLDSNTLPWDCPGLGGHPYGGPTAFPQRGELAPPHLIHTPLFSRTSLPFQNTRAHQLAPVGRGRPAALQSWSSESPRQ